MPRDTFNTLTPFTYTSDGNGGIVITGFTNLDVIAITIPSMIDGLPVTSIGAEAFESNDLTSVTIPNGVTSIGAQAFLGCVELSSVTIPASVVSIGEGAFAGCTSLTSLMVDGSNPYYTMVGGVLFNKNQTKLIQYLGGLSEGSYNIPSSVTSIASYAFYVCPYLTNVAIPAGVTSIPDYAFCGCTYLTSVTIPATVTGIGDYAFDSSGLTSVTLPNGVTSIGGYAFYYCRLTSVTIPNSVISIGDYAFSLNYLTSLTIPNSVSIIGNYAFEGCGSLTSITIPASVTSIGDYAFANIYDLTTSTFLGNAPYMGSHVFDGPHGVITIYYIYNAKGFTSPTWQGWPSSMIAIAPTITTPTCANISTTTATLGGNVTDNGGATVSALGVAFSPTATNANPQNGGAGVTYVTGTQTGGVFTVNVSGLSPNTSYSFAAYASNSVGTSYTVTGTFTTLFPYTYTSTGSAVTITGYTGPVGDISIPGTINGVPVTAIGSNAFANCSGLTSVVVPSSITSIGSGAFANCGSTLTAAFFQGNAPNSDASVFAGDPGLTAYYLVGATGWGSTYEGIAALQLPFTYTTSGSAVTITGYTGSGGNVIIPSTINSLPVTVIGNNAFYGCTSLTSVTIPTTVTTVGDYAFANCTSLASITVPATVTSIGTNVFSGCSSLTGITNPALFLLATDNFSYPNGSQLNGQNGGTGFLAPWLSPPFNSNFNSNQPLLIENGLVSFNPAGPIGQGSQYRQNSFRQLPFSFQAGQQYWISFNLQSLTSAITNGNFQGVSLFDIGGTERLFIGHSTYSGNTNWKMVQQPNGIYHTTATNSVNSSKTAVVQLVIGSSTSTANLWVGADNVTPVNIARTPDATANNLSLLNIAYISVAGDANFTLGNLMLGTNTTSVGDTGISTTTTVATCASPCLYGNTIIFTATITPSSGTTTPTGTVQFFVDGTPLGSPTAITPGTSTNGVASITTNSIPASGSPHTVTAAYTGTGIFNSSTGTLPGGQAVTATLPVVSLPTSTSVTSNSAMLGGTVTSSGGTTPIVFGVVFAPTATNANPQIGGPGVTNATGSGTSGVFTVNVSGLSPDTAYTFAAYATNNAGTGYSATGSFTTPIPFNTSSDGNGGLVITSYKGTVPATLAIPATINGLPVTGIGNAAFQNSYGLTSVTIPSGVTSIGDYAFYNCPMLTTVTIPDGVTSIGAYAFSGCYYWLTSVTIPASVISIGDYAFMNCANLTYVIFAGNAPTTMGTGVFNINNGYGFTVIYYNGATGFTTPLWDGYPCTLANPTVTTPTSAGITSTSATLGGNITSAGVAAVTLCGVVYAPTATNSNPQIGGTGVTNVPGAGTSGVFTVNAGGLTPNTAYTFAAYATNSTGTGYSATGSFYTTPFTYTSDGTGGLVITGYNGTVPATLAIPATINGLSVSGIGRGIFSDCAGLTSVTISSGVTSIGEYAFYGCYNLTEVMIPASVTSIGDYSFFNCNRLTSVTIPSGVTSIGNYVFEGCDGLTSVTIPYGVTSIGEHAFDGCYNLTNMTIPASVTSIGDYAFYDCEYLTSVTIPASVTSIGEYAFSGCNGLTSAIFTGNAPSMGSSVFIGAASGFKIYYYNGATGFTSPSWADSSGDSYPSAIIYPPSVTTPTSTSITDITATLGGNVTANGGATVSTLGVVFAPTATNANPQIGGTGVTNITGTGTSGVFTVNANGLIPNTTYTFAAYATNGAGTCYSATGTFTTLEFNYAVSTSYQNPAALSLGKLSTAVASIYGSVFSVTVAGTNGTSANGGSVALQSGSILYTPPGGFSGTDTFPVTLTNSQGTNISTMVTVTVQSTANAAGIGSNPPEMLNVSPGVSVSMLFHGVPQHTYQVQRSTDLSNWQTISTVQAGRTDHSPSPTRHLPRTPHSTACTNLGQASRTNSHVMKSLLFLCALLPLSAAAATSVTGNWNVSATIPDNSYGGTAPRNHWAARTSARSNRFPCN